LTNPVWIGFQLIEYLNVHPNALYDDLSNGAGFTEVRVCQMIALCRRLPTEITDFLMNINEPEVLKHFTERRLRPLTLMVSDDEKINRFNQMKEMMEVES